MDLQMFVKQIVFQAKLFKDQLIFFTPFYLIALILI